MSRRQVYMCQYISRHPASHARSPCLPQSPCTSPTYYSPRHTSHDVIPPQLPCPAEIACGLGTTALRTATGIASFGGHENDTFPELTLEWPTTETAAEGEKHIDALEANLRFCAIRQRMARFTDDDDEEGPTDGCAIA